MPEQRYFNYCPSRGRMVTKRGLPSTKGRWRTLLRKCESKKETAKLHILAYACLHNLCIKLDVSVLTNRDLSKGDRRTREEIQEILIMTNCTQRRDTQ